MKHPTEIDGFKSLDELAKAIGNLRYDSLAGFLEAFAEEIKRQADTDVKPEHLQLVRKLYILYDMLKGTKYVANSMHDICAQYMNKKD